MSDWVVESHLAVRGDIDAAVAYYDSLNPNLGSDFSAAVARCLVQLPVFPESRREFMPGWRRMVVPKFPYLVLYAVRGRTVFVAAVVNARRDPKTIQATLSDRDTARP